MTKGINMEKCKNIGWMMDQVIQGKKVRRAGWNGKGMFVFGQFPDEHSKMTHSYLVISIPGCTEGTRLLPWQPAQVDMFSEDWEIVE